MADFHRDGNEPSSMHFLKITSMIGDSSLESVLRIIGLILFRPQAL
jgi:hypothetical protein